jgi:hypothetical protein
MFYVGKREQNRSIFYLVGELKSCLIGESKEYDHLLIL